ncbi:hypothetical protein WN943_015175 [Citrus x changshan-huyou]
MSKAKSVYSPFVGHFKLSSKHYSTSEKEKQEMRRILYASVVGSFTHGAIHLEKNSAYHSKSKHIDVSVGTLILVSRSVTLVNLTLTKPFLPEILAWALNHCRRSLSVSIYEEPRNMKLILFIRKAKLIQFMAKLDEKENMKAVIDYLRDDGNVSMIGTFKTWNS